MFKWTDDTVRFREDAALYNGMEKKLAEVLSRRIPRGAKVCDLGCGLGFLSLELAALGYPVTAVDIDDKALEVLERNRKLRGFGENQLKIVKADAFSMRKAQKWDAVVMCFFGTTRESLQLIKRYSKGIGIIVKGCWEKRRFGKGNENRRKICTMEAAEELSLAGIHYQAEKFCQDTGQPFRTLEDAELFFEIYGGDLGKREFEHTGNKDFPLYYPCQRDLGIIVVDTGDIPDSYK